ncbi:hypothetical protein A2U01_0012793 [Trifolium medium]|uniref:Uncharacterized protein n=1 Tax=Trifolium medium TaxID=97028 RepID=A0A392MX32_9FABA|nr:hypothetical protein [Trifolium medium]
MHHCILAMHRFKCLSDPAVTVLHRFKLSLHRPAQKTLGFLLIMPCTGASCSCTDSHFSGLLASVPSLVHPELEQT